ncbi:MAG TPA: STY4851/ECs_5259 family protein [Archangium sp.]|nr:STY4851/ECs_5259 family protein [Archangium sp.]
MAAVSSVGPNVWLDTFLGVAQRKTWFQRKESRPPLYRYRCSDEEFQQLQSLLHDQGPALQQARSRELSALFCLYAAEWLRRNHRGGSWTWDGVLKSISLRLAYNEDQLYALVDQGLSYWGRPLMRDRRRNFLMSLASEGGVPAELVTQEAARFRPFFRDLLAEYRVFGRTVSTTEMARNLAAAALPRSLQRDIVFELCGDLVACVHDLQALVRGQGDPLVELDSQRPGWRDSLPLQLSEEASVALVRGLLDDARQVGLQESSRLRVSTHLWLKGGVGRVQRRVSLPSKLLGKHLEQSFGKPGLANMVRFTLQLADESGARTTLALLTRGAEAEACYLVESARREHLVRAPDALGDLSLLLVGSSGPTWAMTPPGGEARSELPWVFIAEPEPAGGEGSGWKLLSEGTVRTREPRALVAVSPGDRVERESGAEPMRAGVLDASGRALFIVEGGVRIRCASGGTCVVSTGDLSESFVEPRFSGERVETGRGSVFFRGMPRVLSGMANGVERAVAATNLKWRPASSSQPWQAMSGDCVGLIELRQEEHGETHWQARLAILPEQSRIELQPQPQENVGWVLMYGTRAAHAGMHPSPDVRVEPLAPLPDGHGFEVRATGALPPGVGIELRWPRGQYLSLDLVFPARGARFRARDGRVLPPRAEIVVDRLGGTQVEVILPGPRLRPPRLALSLRRKDGTADALDVMLDVPVDGGARELYTLDLACVEATVRALFSCSTDLDSSVELEILGGAGRGRSQSLIVKRYDLTFDFQRTQGEISLVQGAGSGDYALERMQVRAVPLREPEAAELVPVERPGTWRFSLEGRRPGPWLILGSEASWSRVRPQLWTVEPDRQEPARSPLDEAILARPEQRRDKLKAAVQALAQDSEAPDWNLMMAYVDMLAELPATTFDAVVTLSEHPAAAALALFVRDPQRFDTLWRGLEQLPFSWALVSVRDWRAAARVWAAGWRRLVDQCPEERRAALRKFYLGEFETLCKNVESRMAGLKPVFDLLREDVNREPVRMAVKPGQPLRRPSSTALLAIVDSHAVFQPLLEELRRQLFENHEGEEWPQAPKLEEERRAFMDLLPPSLQRLFVEETSFTADRIAVLQAPVFAALCAAWQQPLSVRARLELRRLQDFDTHYFTFVQGLSSRQALATLHASAPERLR